MKGQRLHSTQTPLFLFCFAPDVLKGQNFKDHKKKIQSIQGNVCILNLYLFTEQLTYMHFLTWNRKASPRELLRQNTKSFLGCSGTAWTILFSTQMACLGLLLLSIPERPSVS